MFSEESFKSCSSARGSLSSDATCGILHGVREKGFFDLLSIIGKINISCLLFSLLKVEFTPKFYLYFTVLFFPLK